MLRNAKKSLLIMAEPIIQVQSVVKKFDGRTVLDEVKLEVMRGETLVILGGSGSGKSTLLRLMIGNEKLNGGDILSLGKSLSRMSVGELDDYRRSIGVLFQSGALFNSMTVAENVALPLREHTDLPDETIEIMVKIKLELVGLRTHADKMPAMLSGGMKKRAGLARAISLDPKILFYDEPSAGLDPVTSTEIDHLIMDLNDKLGVTSVVVTHEMDSAFAIADRMVMLDKGRVLAVEDRAWFDNLRKTPGELPLREALIRQFLRGDAQGPITQRRQTSNYSDDLLGAPVPLAEEPSLVPTRML